MQRRRFDETLQLILKDDPRYPADAYYFLRQALQVTIRLYDKPENGPARHVTGKELLEGIRSFALQEFGPVALTVLKTWGITRTEDFGEIVFNMVNKGALGKTSEDKKEDFAGGYDFEDAFVRPFLPKGPASTEPKPVKARPPRKRPAPQENT